MKIRRLYLYLTEKISLDELLRHIETETINYLNTIVSSKSSIEIKIDEGNYKFYFTDNYLIKLLRLYINKKILEWDLEYLLNAVELSELDMSKNAEEIIFIFSTPEINFPITDNNVINCIRYLNRDIKKLKLESYNSIDFKQEYRSIFINNT